MERLTLFSFAIFSIALTIYHNSLSCGFVFDDVSAIKDNKDLRPKTPIQNLFWNDFWGTPMHKESSHKSYRPLCVLTFRLNYAMSELNPQSYHLVNNILHAVVSVLFLHTSARFVSIITAFIAALLFAVHPIHTEAVTGVVGRAEMLSAIFYLMALRSYMKCSGFKTRTKWIHLVSAVVYVVVATLCKEQGITAVAVCGMYELFCAQRMNIYDVISLLLIHIRGKVYIPKWLLNAILRGMILVGSTGFLMFARIKVMGAQLPVFTRFDNPASVAPTPHRQLTYNYLLPVNAWLLLAPNDLCCDWTMGTIPLVETLSDWRNLQTIVFYTLFGLLAKRALISRGYNSRALVVSLSLILFPFLPASNLFFPVGFVVAERILYVPSMGFCLLVAIGFRKLCFKWTISPAMWSGLALLLVSHSVKTVVRNQHWETEYTLFEAALRVNTRNAKLFNNVGHALENKQDYHNALIYFMHAVRVQYDDIGAHINVGRTFNNLERFKMAEVAYRRALDLMPAIKPGQSYTTRIAPGHLAVYLNLGNLLAKNDSRLLEADSLYRQAISMRSDYVQAYINRGDVLMRLNRSGEALQQYKVALTYDPDNADILYNIGVVLLDQGDASSALQHFEGALRLNPDHKQTLFNSAVLMQETGQAVLRPEAYRRLHQLRKSEPDNEKVYFNLGMLAMDEKKFPEAERWFMEAIALKEDFRSALFNLALMLVNDLRRPLDAVPVLEQLLKHHPQHTKGLILMGDVNINHVKNLHAAEENFQRILRHDPNNIQANHNLCVVYVERGDLLLAEKCLVKASALAPQESYIKNHLNIVRNRLSGARTP